MDSYKVVKLACNTSIFVSKNHGFGTDACLLASFSECDSEDLVCDLGTGCGIIPFLVYIKFKVKRVDGLDIQKDAVLQFQESINKNGVGENVQALYMDIKDITQKMQKASYTKVITNPPYVRKGAGKDNKNQSHTIAKKEVLCDIEDICKAASYLLKDKGQFYICQRPDRLVDVLTAMRQNNIEPRKLRFVTKTKDELPWLILVSGIKNGGKNFKVCENLNMYENGSYTEEVKDMYKMYNMGEI